MLILTMTPYQSHLILKMWNQPSPSPIPERGKQGKRTSRGGKWDQSRALHDSQKIHHVHTKKKWAVCRSTKHPEIEAKMVQTAPWDPVWNIWRQNQRGFVRLSSK